MYALPRRRKSAGKVLDIFISIVNRLSAPNVVSRWFTIMLTKNARRATREECGEARDKQAVLGNAATSTFCIFPLTAVGVRRAA